MPLRIAALAYTDYESDPRVRREAEALAARGDDVTVWALRKEGRPAQETLEGVRVHRLEVPRYRGGRAGAYVASYLRFLAEAKARLAAAHLSSRFDVVHVHTMPDFMVFAALFPRLAGAKVLLDMHDLMPDLYKVKFALDEGNPILGALRLSQRAATAFADAVLAVHQNQYELLLRDGVPARKLGIVMNAADPRLFPRREVEPPSKGSIRVVYHGTVLHRYGVDVALKAFARARAEEPHLSLAVLGGGDYVEPLRALAKELSLGPEALTITGEHRPLEEIAQTIREAHLGLVPNRDDHEDSVLPTKLLEYLAVGIPSVASRTRAVSRFFDAREVELVDVGDEAAMAQAILRLARDEKRRRSLIEGGWSWQLRYGWEVQKGFLFRTVDGLCAEKVEAERRARQAVIEATKTGTKRDLPRAEAGSSPVRGTSARETEPA